MDHADEVMRENEALRERLSRLSEASLRINEDLDLDTVLREVVDGARSLTGARMGGITVLDDSGQLQDFITSGLTPEEHQRFVDLPGGPEFFAYLSNLPEPLRLSDFSAYTTALGLPEIGPPLGPVGSFLGAPIRHRGQHVGNFYLSGKEGGAEFTDEDEETLAMFASHAAMAIANARRLQSEQRAKKDLETLIDTSPVGVVVFDATTGSPVSLNMEGRRIVDGLRSPDQSAEQLLDVLTFRRADGREISLREFPLAQALSTGETVRAEEIVIGVPDGRSVTVLLNATPIRSEEGEVESVVVTLQDMTAVEELERLRAEFLAMVSHELRAPLTSIKGSAATVLGSPADMDPAVVRQFFRIIDEQADHMHDLVSDLLDVARIATGTLSVAPEPAEVAVLVDRARSTFISGGGRNNLSIDIESDLPLVMADRLRIAQVIGNLLSNAARHSSESSRHQGDRRAGGLSRCGLGCRRGKGHTFRAAAPPVQEVHPVRGRGRGGRHRPGPSHLQGDSGGARGPNMGRERGAGHGSAVHLHHPFGRGGWERTPVPLNSLLAAGGGGTGARPRGGRRPPSAQVR